MWEGAYFWGIRYAPVATGLGPSASQFWGSLLFIHTPFEGEVQNLAR